MNQKRLRGMYKGSLDQKAKVWGLLARGLTAKQVLKMVDIDMRTVYAWDKEFKSLSAEELIAAFEPQGAPPKRVMLRWKRFNQDKPQAIREMNALVAELPGKSKSDKWRDDHHHDLRQLAEELWQQFDDCELGYALAGWPLPVECTVGVSDGRSESLAQKQLLFRDLQSHLDRGELWAHLEGWNKEVPLFMHDAQRLHRQVRDQAEKKTGLRVRDDIQVSSVLDLDKAKVTTRIDGLEVIGAGLLTAFVETILQELFADVTGFVRRGANDDLAYTVEERNDCHLLAYAGRFIAAVPSKQVSRCQRVHEELRTTYRQAGEVAALKHTFVQLRGVRRRAMDDLSKIALMQTFKGKCLVFREGG